MSEKKAFNFQTVKEPVFEYIDAEGKTHAPKLWDLHNQLRGDLLAALKMAKAAALQAAKDAGADEPDPIDDLDITRQVIGKVVGIPSINQQQAIAFQAAVAEAIHDLDELKKVRQLSQNS